MGSEDLAKMVEQGDLDGKFEDKATNEVLASTLATTTCKAL